MERDRYHEDNPYLRYLIKQRGNLGFDLRNLVRNFLRVYYPLKLKPGDCILDVGSCLGILGHDLKYGQVKTFGVDIDIKAINKCKEIFGKEGQNLPVVAEANSLPYRDGTFDVVVSQDFFEHQKSMDLEDIFKEMVRVLKPNKKRMFHKITVLEDTVNINNDLSHQTKWSTQQWVHFFEKQGWVVVGNPTRHFPIASNVSYGNFLLQRK